jgi:hypothetical protein
MLGLGNVCLKRTSLRQRSAVHLIDRRIPVTDVISQSPDHEQALAAGIFHLNRCSLAPRIFHLNRHAIVQALAPRIFHLNRRNLATRIFHLDHRVIGQSLAPDHFFSKLRQA